jgi:hypothetical protein
MQKIILLSLLIGLSLPAAWAESPFQTCNKKAIPFYKCMLQKKAACQPGGGFVHVPEPEYCTLSGGNVTCEKNPEYTPELKQQAEQKLAAQKAAVKNCDEAAAKSCDAGLAKYYVGSGIDMAKCVTDIKNGTYKP